MRSVKEKIVNIYEINKSKFISIIFYFDDINNLSSILENIKKEYKDASHYCYAYILDNNKKCSDDKEPSGTAGKPILDVLEKNDMSNVLCVVVRYFGGIKLGAGGLLRAYSKAVSDNLDNNKDKIGNIVFGYLVKLEVNYSEQGNIEYKYKDIKEKTYQEKIEYKIFVEDQELDELESKYNIISKEKTLFVK